MADLPIACTLSQEALKARRENLLAALLQRSTERIDLPMQRDRFFSTVPRPSPSTSLNLGRRQAFDG